MNFISYMVLAKTLISAEYIDDLLQHRVKKPPMDKFSSSLNVRMGMYLESLGNFRSTEMSFDADLYVYMSWRDHRLAHNHTDYVLINDDVIRQKIWLPDLYFANARQAQFQEVTVPNFNLFVAPDGTCAYSLRCTLTVACSLDLRFYPMDIQLCSIRVLSYAYIANQMNVSWFDENPIRFNPEIGLPEFHITDVSKGYCNGTYRYALTPESYKLDDFSCLAGQLFLARSIGYNLVQSYIPTGLIVMISWVSFWIDRRAVPARVTLSFTTLVSLTTLGNGLRFGLPQVSYAKAIDLWYGACMMFVFLALLEFAIINSYMRKSEKFEGMAKRLNNNNIHSRNATPHRLSVLDARNGFISNGGTNGNIHYVHLDPNTPNIGAKKRKVVQCAAEEFNLVNLSDTLESRLIFCMCCYDFTKACATTRTGFNTNFIAAALKWKESINVSVYDNVSPWSMKNIDEPTDSSDSDSGLWRLRKRNHRKRSTIDGNDESSKSALKDETNNYTQMSKGFSRRALRIDKLCRYGFPLSFVVWNAWYWWYYLVHTKITSEQLARNQM